MARTHALPDTVRFTMAVKRFATVAELQAWLAERGIDTRSWGGESGKTLIDLWEEYCRNEADFHDVPPHRRLRVVRIAIEREGRCLLELEQELESGLRRVRQSPPSEKMKVGETAVDAARRCLREELGLQDRDVTLLEVLPENDEVIVESPSYPGLRTHYLFFSVRVASSALPETDFWRENKATGDPVRRHLWGWR